MRACDRILLFRRHAPEATRHLVDRTIKTFFATRGALTNEAYQAINQSIKRADEIAYLRSHRFDFVKHKRDSRNSFDGIMTRDAYPKAASFACLTMMVPSGKIALAGEQDAVMARVVRHIFRDGTPERPTQAKRTTPAMRIGVLPLRAKKSSG